MNKILIIIASFLLVGLLVWQISLIIKFQKLIAIKKKERNLHFDLDSGRIYSYKGAEFDLSFHSHINYKESKVVVRRKEVYSIPE